MPKTAIPIFTGIYDEQLGTDPFAERPDFRRPIHRHSSGRTERTTRSTTRRFTRWGTSRAGLKSFSQFGLDLSRNRMTVRRLTKAEPRRRASLMSDIAIGPVPSREALLERMTTPLAELCTEGRRLRDEGHGVRVTYSRKVFIPLTRLCRDVCAYCTFAKPPRPGERCYFARDEVLRSRGGRQSWLCGGAVHAGRQTGTALSPGARGTDRTRSRHNHLLSHARCVAPLSRTPVLLPHANPGVMSFGRYCALAQSHSSPKASCWKLSLCVLCERGGGISVRPTRSGAFGLRPFAWPARRAFPSPLAS